MYIVIEDGILFNRINLEDSPLPYIYKGIEILKKNDNYYLSLKAGYFFDDRDKVRRIEYKKYTVKHKDIFNDIYIYVYKNDDGFKDYAIYENKSFIVASSKKASIVNFDLYFANYYLYYNEKKLKSNSDVLLLNGKIYKDEELKDGDEVRFYNFVFYYYDDYLYINKFKIENKLPLKDLRENVVHYEHVKPISRNYYLPKKRELVNEKIVDYKETVKKDSRSIIFAIGPGLTMSLAMLAIASINAYNGIINGTPLYMNIIYLLMPLTMMISGVVWPICSSITEKKKEEKKIKEDKEKYLNYLRDYEVTLKKRIDDYLKMLNEDYFSGKYREDKLFYLTERSNDFLCLSIGKIKLKKEFEVKNYEDEDVNEVLNRIKYHYENIEDCPYLLPLREYDAVSVIANKNKRQYLFRKFLLDLASKNHYDDFYLAIYADEINQYSDFFSLPQLIYKNTRLTLNKKRELQELNSQLLDKPLVLIAGHKIDFRFTNPNIHLIYFASDMNGIYKDSRIVVEYLKEGGFIYLDNKIPFKEDEDVLEEISFIKTLKNYQKINSFKKTISFKDIFGNIDVKSNYRIKQNGLRADFAYMSKELLSFDLHESKNGPHGLIGGSTGSGKSELIVSMLLSLCFRYRPDYLNIVLIDYKGGGIKDSLSYKGESVPHIIASISNLDSDAFERLIVAIEKECKTRQELFKELSNKTLDSIMNIDDYLDHDYKKFNLPDIAHLLIVVDEFAELKKDYPELIKELISFSRIGRSLGIHLILATQRPSGSIDDEIWSNARFKIALRVFSEKDSNDIIKNKNAAYLSEAGEFYLSVDDNLVKAQSIYSKKDINNAEPYEVALLDNRLNVIKKKKQKDKESNSEASYLVKQIIEASNDLRINNIKMNFEKPRAKTIEEIETAYGNSENNFVLGEIDDYLNASKGMLAVEKDENILIFSSRDKEINNILNNLKYRTAVIASKIYKNERVVSSSLYNEEKEIDYLFKKLIKEEEKMTLVIEDISVLLAYKEEYSYYIYQLIRRERINVIALSRNSNISFKLLNCFKHKFVIGTSDRQDLINIFSANSKYKGDSFFMAENPISFVPVMLEDFKTSDSDLSYIKKIPTKLTFEKNKEGTLIGFDIETREMVYVKNDENLLISSFDEDVIGNYKEIYKNQSNIEVKLYTKNKEDRRQYLWIGEGLGTQRLFYASERQELHDGEAYYYKNGKGHVLKTVSYE